MEQSTFLLQQFEPVISYIKEAERKFGASASAVILIQDNDIVAEWYSGQHHFKSGALTVTSSSMFNLYSTRKTYVGLATALAVIEGQLSIDTKVSDIVTDMSEDELNGVTIRDLAIKSNAKYYGPH